MLPARIALSVLFFVVGGLCARLVLSWREGPERTYLEEGVDPTIPSPALTPEVVVQAQVSAVQAATSDPSKMVICYSLTSPQNRSVTGPIDRFARMAFTEPYDILVGAVHWQAGEAHIDGNVAVVLVTARDADGNSAAYRFYLSKQSSAPYKGCWLTDIVEPLTNVGVDGSEGEPFNL